MTFLISGRAAFVSELEMKGQPQGIHRGRLREKTVEEQNIGNRNLLENVRANTEQEIELAVQEKQPSLNVQIWKRYVDQIDISIVSPTGAIRN